jgi:hypothetical protein
MALASPPVLPSDKAKTMQPEKQSARLCGLVYLVVVVTGIFTFMYVPGQIVVQGDASATLANIIAKEGLYRSSIASLLANQIAFFVLPLALYRLLAPVNESIAKIMVLAALAGIPIALVSAAERMLILDAINNGPGLTQAALTDLVTVSRVRAGQAINFAGSFWGLWLLPFGYLVYKSGFLPRFLGAILMAGCFGYLINLFGYILIDDYAATTMASIVRMPASIGEIGICLWLLLVGVWRRA